MKQSILILGVFLSALSGYSQGLTPSPQVPQTDGVVGNGEYAQAQQHGDMKLNYSLSADGKTLYLCLEAPTSGWVSVGLGSLKMDGAFMVMGYDSKGNSVISEQTGKRHTHTPNSTNKLLSAKALETSGKTLLEFSIPASEYVVNTKLQMILAFGKNDNLNSIHSKFAQVEIPLVITPLGKM